MFQALLRRREARLFFIISILFFICIHSIDAFLAPMMINQGIEPQIMGIIMGASGLATLLIRFPLGIISDVVKSRRIFIQIGLLLPIIAWPIAWLEPNAITLYLAKAADGVTAATWVLYNILFMRYFGRNEAPAAVALLALAGPIGVFLGNCIGAVLIHYFANNIAFFVSCISALVALILTTRIQDVHDPVQAPTLKACITGAPAAGRPFRLADWHPGDRRHSGALRHPGHPDAGLRRTARRPGGDPRGARKHPPSVLRAGHRPVQLGVLSAPWAGKNRRARHRFTGGLHLRHSLYQQYVRHLPVAGAGRVFVRYGLCRIHVAQRSEYLV